MKAAARIHNSSSARRGFNELLNYQQLVADGVALLKDGALLAGFWYEGHDLEAATDGDLESLRAHIKDAFQCLGGNWMLHVECMRRREHGYIDGVFVEATDLLIDEERADRATYLRSYTAIFVTWLPPRLAQTSFGQRLQNAFATDEGQLSSSSLARLKSQLAHFEETLLELSGRAESAVAIRRMRSQLDNCELLQAINYVVNGQWRPCRPPPRGMYLDTYLSHAAFNQNDYVVSDDSAVVVVTVIGYPEKGTYVGMLNALGRLSLEYRWSNRFIVLGYVGSKTLFGRLHKAWSRMLRGFSAQVLKNHSAPQNQDAAKRIAEVHHAQSDLESHASDYGHHTATVVLRGASKEEALARAKEVRDAFHAAGFTAYIENVNGFDAWLGSFPGHGYENVTKPGITTEQLADVIPLHRDWRGSETSTNPLIPAGSPPLMQVKSRSHDAVYLNLHVGDVPHTLLLGPTGAGKSAFLGMMASQYGRYADSQVFCFDFEYSMQTLALAQRDGVHYALGAEGGVRLAPLAAIDTPTELAWACDWLRSLFHEQKLTLTPEQGAELDQAVADLAATTSEVADRSLTALLAFLQDRAMRDALRFYTSGPGAAVLNGDSADLRYTRFTVFELSHLMELKSAVATPTLLYLFHEIEKRLRVGRPSLLMLDEAWLALGNSLFAPKIGQWLVTLRKANCAVVLATQLLSQLLSSPISGEIIQSCHTRILLANRGIRSESIARLYTTNLQLNDAQVSLIANAQPKRDYYYTSTKGHSRMFNLDLGPVALSFIGVNGAKALQRVRSLYAEHGPDDWGKPWLEERGLPDAGRRWQELRSLQSRKRWAA
ncbi:MAG: CagE, TrbE, VirB component of type transporter system, conserved region [Myxococcaceae bacterium]|nr:CagE, TrbE, VirB component of type transporter system, conserved region [Myxococcaceae bacterium]